MPEEQETFEPVETDTQGLSEEAATEPEDIFSVTIDGEDSEVTLSELRSGYQRQADYTRKTQEIAEERQRLQQAETIVSALEADPAGTLRALGSAFGVEADTPPPASKSSTRSFDPWEESEQETVDPTDQRIAKLEGQLERQAQLTRQQNLANQVEDLKSKYGEFDDKQLYQHALKHRIPNLEVAYTHMTYGDVTAAAQKLQADAEVTERKRDAAVVGSGSATQSGAVVSDQMANKRASTIREAFALAKKQHS
jgi:hypothetical protein